MPLLYNKQCIICGRFFQPNKHNQITCGDISCKREQNKRYKKGTLKQSKKMALLVEESTAAFNLGMTYGQYKAKQWCRNKQYIRKYVGKEVPSIVS